MGMKLIVPMIAYSPSIMDKDNQVQIWLIVGNNYVSSGVSILEQLSQQWGEHSPQYLAELRIVLDHAYKHRSCWYSEHVIANTKYIMEKKLVSVMLQGLSNGCCSEKIIAEINMYMYARHL